MSQNQANENYFKVGIIFKHFYYEKWLWNSLKKELCCTPSIFSLCRCGVFKAQYKRPTILVGNVRCFVSIRHLCDYNCVLDSWVASQTKCHIELGEKSKGFRITWLTTFNYKWLRIKRWRLVLIKIPLRLHLLHLFSVFYNVLILQILCFFPWHFLDKQSPSRWHYSRRKFFPAKHKSALPIKRIIDLFKKITKQ